MKLFNTIKKKKVEKKKHIHNFDIEQCDFCGHTCEYCSGCEKGRCDAETKDGKEMKFTNPYK